MRIRDEQIQVFKDNASTAFVREVAVHLRTNFADDLATQGLPEQETEALVREGIAKANGYGIETRHDVVKYVELMAMLGPRFDMDPSREDIPYILQDPILPGHEKISAILTALSWPAI